MGLGIFIDNKNPKDFVVYDYGPLKAKYYENFGYKCREGQSLV